MCIKNQERISDLKETWTCCVQKEQYCKPAGFLSSEKLKDFKKYISEKPFHSLKVNKITVF